MKKTILLLVITIFGFWLVFLSLQNEKIYTNTLGIVSKNWQNINGERKLVNKPYSKLTNSNFIHWDAAHYKLIKEYGYNIKKSGGDYIYAFFPLFPAIWKLFSLPPIGVIFLNYIFISLSIIILLSIFSSSKHYIRDVLIALSFPSIIIFLIPYTEATYFLMISIGVWGMIKNKYWVFFVGLFLASLTRPSFTFLFLSIIGVELFLLMQHKMRLVFFKNLFFNTLPLIIGTLVVSGIQLLQGSGHPFKFIQVQKYWSNILSMPHNLRDWSHEGFAINIGVIFLVFTPIIIIVAQLIYKQFLLKQKTIFRHKDLKSYTILLSIIYILGNALFIILFRGGSLHCLFRFTLSSPFAFILLFGAFNYIKKASFDIRFFGLASLAFVSIFVLGLANYSTYWNFSDLGLFILIIALGLWLFQDLYNSIFYKTVLYLNYSLNIVWTTYLFNTYINNGWIFA